MAPHAVGPRSRREDGDVAQKAGDWYYNLETREVEKGLVSDWTKRIGPYPTREAAEHALDIAASRNATWDEADRAWRGED